MSYTMVSKTISELHIQHEAALQHRTNENFVAAQELNYIKRKYLDYINELIFRITYELKNETGFVYDEHGFTALSNYRYEDDEIKFDINRVLRTEEEFIISESPKEKEAEFYSKYKSVLNRLIKLEQKRSALIPKTSDKIVSIGGSVQRSIIEELREKQSYYRLFVNMKAENFLKDYGKEGLFILINLLNSLASYNDVEGLTTYIKSQNLPYDTMQAILTWAALYDKRAETILDSITRERLTSYLYENGEYPFSDDLSNQDSHNKLI